MPKRVGGSAIGAWAFLIGVILAVVIGLFSAQLGVGASGVITVAVFIIGILVGLLNVAEKEANSFLLASVSLVIVSFMGASVLGVISQIAEIFNALLVMFIPATVIVALKSVFAAAKS